MAEPFIGQINIFGFNFAPRGWAFCNGQILSIAQNTALFSLLGTQYGGNGQTTFALPNLQSRIPVHFGTGPGLSQYVIGEQGGVENTTLLQSQLPIHNHTYAPLANNSDAGVSKPGTAFMGKADAAIYASASDGTTVMGTQICGAAGGNQPFPNLPPYLAVNFCIATQGIFPSRN